jgi:uncharacterized protein (TIGR03382 family)
MNSNNDVTATFNALPPVTTGSLEISPSGLPSGATSSIAVTGPGGFNRTFSIPSGMAQSVSDVAAGQYDGVAANVVVGADTWVPRPATPSTAVLGGGKGVISTTYALGRPLTVTKAGAGAGTVTSNPAALSCGATCMASFPDGETVTLTAAPAAGSSFGGWSGGCTGTGSCQLAMSAARSVTATFAPVATADGGVPDGGVPVGGAPDGGAPDGGAPDGGAPDGGGPALSPAKSGGGCSTGPAAIPVAAVLLTMLAVTRARRRGTRVEGERS